MTRLKTMTRNELFVALFKHMDDLPDWDEVDSDEGVVWIRFYTHEEQDDDAA